MDEARFVLKCFVFAAAVLVFSQIKTKSGSTIENQIQATLMGSEMSTFVNKAAEGGTKAIQDGISYLKAKYEKNNSPTKKALEEKSVGLHEAAINKIAEINTEIKTAVNQKTEASKKDQPIFDEDELIEEIE